MSATNRQALLPVAPSGRLDPQMQPEAVAVLPGTANRLDELHRQSECGTRHGTSPSEQHSAGRRNDRHRTNESASLDAKRWQDQEPGRNQAQRTRPSQSGRGMGNSGLHRTRMQPQSEGNTTIEHHERTEGAAAPGVIHRRRDTEPNPP